MLTPFLSSDENEEGILTEEELFYPAENGEPMAESHDHHKFINEVFENFSYRYAKEPLVSVHSDLIWYPIEGDNQTSIAPDIMIIFGRAPVNRRNYQMWQEDNIAPQMVWEIWSNSNKQAHKAEKLEFYNRYGVEEFIAIDLDNAVIEIWERSEMTGNLEKRIHWQSWRSKRTGITFRVREETIHEKDHEGKSVYRTNPRIVVIDQAGVEFRSYEEVCTTEREALERADKADQALQTAEAARQTAEAARQEAENRATQEAIARQTAEADLIAKEQRIQELLSQLQELQRRPQDINPGE